MGLYDKDASAEKAGNAPWINVVFPVYNEERRIERGISKTVAFLQENGFDDYVITIADNGSTDDTRRFAEEMGRRNPRIYYMEVGEKGVGAAVRKAIGENESSIIGYMDIDLATDLSHLMEVIRIFQADESVDFINGSRWAKGYGSTGRGIKRTITSMGLTVVLKGALGMKASDAICGFKFFRKDVAEQLVSQSGDEENGWFYIIEMLLAAERGGVNIKELPVIWKDDGNSSVDVVPMIKEYLTQIARFRKRLRELDHRKATYVEVDIDA